MENRRGGWNEALADGKFMEKCFPLRANAEKYLLQNNTQGYLGNSPVFWREGGRGYTQWIDEAKLWTKDEAERQVRSTSGSHSWTIWKLSEIESVAKRTVDIQDLRKKVDDPCS